MTLRSKPRVASGGSLVRPSLQARSRATTDAIVAAGLALLRERPFEAVSVAQVARRAGVSVGGFYARFHGKEALLDALAVEVLGDCRRALDAALGPRRMAGASVATVVAAYVRVMIRKFRQHREAIAQILRHARQGAAPHGAEIRAFNQHVHGRLRALLHERRHLIAHPDPDLAVNIGLFVVSAAAREAVLAGSLRAYPVRGTDRVLERELTRAYVAYLTARDPNPRRRS